MAHRPRPMRCWRRTLLTCALLLLAGAVVNVAVAWVALGSAGLWGNNWTWEEPQWHDALPQHARAKRIGYEVGPGYGSSLETQTLYAEERTYWSSATTVAGWPFLSVRCVRQERWTGHWTQRQPTAKEQVTVGAVRRGAPAPPVIAPLFGMSARRLPIDPLFPGFLLNTLFYAIVVGAILALPLRLVPLRRRRRARRGRCPTCNYDLAGLAGPCPECGAAR